ncbi:kinase-like domain-containing protein [Biscogniauxia sp. FL1348]|nr:kinase-like domain-containing protein [Biscogniauxia sp. FL1348]
MESMLEVTTALETRLDNSQVVNEAGKLFIPDGTLEQILDENTVCRALSELSVFHDEVPGGPEQYARKICSPESPFRKILALLLLAGISDTIIIFVDLGINDLALPMPDPRLILSYDPSDSCNNKQEDNWNKWKLLAESWVKRSFLRNIYMRQWCLLAPSFSRQSSISHYEFTPDHILPFLQNGGIAPSNSELSNSSNGSVRHGSFSQVRRVKIHPNHYDFGDYGVWNPDHQFAVKRLLAHDYEKFTEEIEVFKRHWRCHIQIVPLLATYEVRETVTDDPIISYCLVFPWAAGDMQWFWEANEELVRDQKITPWIARECYEITRALSHIHEGLCHPADSAGSFGRHGDIKPSNILWYPSAPGVEAGDLGKLVLADFGLTDFHRAASRTNSGTDSCPRSVTYRAPEFDTTKVISRAIDVWALGCTFLELITWFIKGNQAVREEFPVYRSELDMYGIHADIFFRIQQRDGQPDVLVKPQVTAWTNQLCEDRGCSRYLKDFLSIIRCEMLVVDRRQRQTAAEISRKLEALYLRCVSDVDYCQAPEISHDLHSATEKPPTSGAKGETSPKKGRLGTSLRNMFRPRSQHMDSSEQ